MTGSEDLVRPNLLLSRMLDRVEVTRSESETAIFYDLLFLGELLTKACVSGLVAAVEDDRERHRYRLEHKLVRANGIGQWAEVLDDLLVGPASAHLLHGVVFERREITQGFTSSSSSWQRHAIEGLRHVQLALEPSRAIGEGKASLKTWFNEFAWLRNRTRGHGAPKPAMCQALIDPLEMSIQVIIENLTLFRRGWAFVRRNLSGKYRVSPIGGDASAFDFLKSDATFELEDGLYIDFENNLRRVELIASDADLSDFFVCNGDFKVPKSGNPQYELLSYVTDDRQFGDGSRFLIPPEQLPPSETQGQPAMEVVGGSFANLPPKSPGYVRREDLERELLELLRDDRHPVATLVGRGGVGKTSLAIEVLHELAESGDYFAIVWFSSRDIDLLADGPKPVTPAVLTKEEIAVTYADLMHPGWRREQDFDPVQWLADSLSGGVLNEPILFVFDNFETVSSPAELYQFIDKFVRLPNKALLTSRFRDFKADYPVAVAGLTRAQFDELVAATARQLQIEGLVSSEYLNRLFDESDGHPYVTKILLGETARTRRAGTIERVMAGQDEILTALFERTFSSIKPAERRVFLTLCNWRSAVPRLALEAALLRPANDRVDVAAALDALQRSSLIELVDDPAGGNEEFVLVPLAAYLFGQRKLRVSPMKAAVEADTEILQLFGATNRSEISRGIGPRVTRMLSAVAARQAAGRDVSDELEILGYVGRHHPPALLQIADFYADSGDWSKAAEAVSGFVEVAPEDRRGWLRLAELRLAGSDGPGEVHARVEAARLPGAPLEDISNAARTLSRHLFNRTAEFGEDERRAMLDELRGLLSSREDECDATDLSRLAWLLLALGKNGEAARVTRLGLERDPANRHCLGLASRQGIEMD